MNATREITIYEQIPDPAAAMVQLGTAIAKSQIFGCQNEAQGQVLALECMSKRLSPLSLAEKYDIIQGKLSMKADAMLAGFEEAGGKYKVVSYTPDECMIEFDRNGSKLMIGITWEDAQQESWPYGKDGKSLKHNWASPIGRQDMLWARVVSRGVRRLAPGVVCGRYTPEEIVDFSDSPVPTVDDLAGQSQAVDAEFTKVVPAIEPKATSEPAPVPSEPIDGPVSDSMVERIKKSIGQAAQLGVTDIAAKVKEKLTSVGLAKIADLTSEEAQSLFSAIEQKSLGAWLDNPVEGHAACEGDSEN